MSKKIAVLTGGGDCPGLNAVIRAVARKSFPRGYELVGALEGWRGMLEPNFKPLGPADVSGILHRGGTIIGTSRTNPYNVEGGVEKLRKNFADAGLDALVAIENRDETRCFHLRTAADAFAPTPRLQGSLAFPKDLTA